jgi:hypothetical protein
MYSFRLQEGQSDFSRKQPPALRLHRAGPGCAACIFHLAHSVYRAVGDLFIDSLLESAVEHRSALAMAIRAGHRRRPGANRSLGSLGNLLFQTAMEGPRVSGETYRRLPGVYRTPASKWTLWMAADHLLLIRSSRISEQYRRFYFRDIQAIALCKRDGVSDQPVIRYVALSIFAFLFLVSYRSAFGGLSSLLLFTYLFWWLQRRDCVCHIQTATQTERIPPLSHLRVASRVIREIRSKIETAQSEHPAGAASSAPQPPPPIV